MVQFGMFREHEYEVEDTTVAPFDVSSASVSNNDLVPIEYFPEEVSGPFGIIFGVTFVLILILICRYWRNSRKRYDLPLADLMDYREVTGESGQLENSVPTTAGHHTPPPSSLSPTGPSRQQPSVRYGTTRICRMRKRYDLPLADLMDYREVTGESGQLENSVPTTAGVHTPPASSLSPTVRYGTTRYCRALKRYGLPLPELDEYWGCDGDAPPSTPPILSPTGSD